MPEFRPRLVEMKAVSDVWGALVDAWGDLIATLNEECPEWRSGRGGNASRTYALMRAIGC